LRHPGRYGTRSAGVFQRDEERAQQTVGLLAVVVAESGEQLALVEDMPFQHLVAPGASRPGRVPPR
jgi:hypothetical protein